MKSGSGSECLDPTGLGFVSGNTGKRNFRRQIKYRFFAVFRIRISFHADLDPGYQKSLYGSGFRPLIFYSDADSKGGKN